MDSDPTITTIRSAAFHFPELGTVFVGARRWRVETGNKSSRGLQLCQLGDWICGKIPSGAMKTNATLYLGSAAYDNLLSHLIRPNPRSEEAAFIFATRRGSDDSLTYVESYL